MSLVEKALSKMKQAERLAKQAAIDSTPAPLEPVAALASAPAHAPAHAPAPVAVVEPLRAAPPLDPIAAAAPARQARTLQIDADTLRSAGYLPPPQQERELIEQYRHIKRPLVARALGRSGAGASQRRMNVLMVTSALPQEGKTFTALNLTRSFALEKDASVLLVDGDVLNPQTTRVLGAAGMPGLVDALCDESIDVESLVCGTNVPGLQVLPVGRSTDLGAELLGSQRMEHIIARLLQAAPSRILLVDTAPLLITNEGKALIHLAGQVVLVVKANATPQHAVLEAADLFAEDQYVGVVLNQCEEAVGLGYGYYGGTYNYGGTYGQGRKDVESGHGS